jgi:hypothetical protein|tara:strand:- start:67 stop:678 length:612 start_codon:yes stop_codon:yes gene_type:complete
LLKAAKAIVAYRSAICVAKAGFYTEVATLMRVVAECCTFVEWAAHSVSEHACAEYRARVDKLVEEYFSDNQRTVDQLPQTLRVRQKEIHDMHGQVLDVTMASEGIESKKSASELMSSVYVRFSKYVHAGYPETIDLYGKRLGELSLKGASGSSKDLESFNTLESFRATIELAVAAMIVRLKPELIERMPPAHQKWFQKMLGEA